MYTLKEIMIKLGVTPSELRELANELEKNRGKVLTYEQKMYNHYFEEITKKKKAKK